MDAAKAAKKKGKKAKRESKSIQDVRSTMLVFSANWCDRCVYTHSMWVRFANRFSTDRFRFVEVDTTKFVEIARTFKVNARDGNQLPTVILLEDNVEKERFTPINYETGAVGRILAYKEKELIRHFDLEKRYMATMTRE